MGAHITYVPVPDPVPDCVVPNCSQLKAVSQVVAVNIAFEFVVIPVCSEHNNHVINAQSEGIVELQRYEKVD